MSIVYKALIYFGSCSVYLFIWFCLSKAWFKIMPPENRDDVTRMGCGLLVSLLLTAIIIGMLVSCYTR